MSTRMDLRGQGTHRGVAGYDVVRASPKVRRVVNTRDLTLEGQEMIVAQAVDGVRRLRPSDARTCVEGS